MKERNIKIIQKVADIRAKNNFLWMALLGLAMDAYPEDTRKILAQIKKNDGDVSKWLTKL